MPISIPVQDKAAGDVLTESDWDLKIRDNINKLLDRGHRVLTVAQFTALTGLEDGDEAYVEVDAANGIMWHFRYVAVESTYKWRFLGGPPMSSLVATAESTASGTYVALTTAGPSLALPRSGDYGVQTGFNSFATGATQNGTMSYDIGGAGAVDADGVTGTWFSSDHSRFKRKTGLTPVTLTAKYKQVGGATAGWGVRTMVVTPIRIRHDA